MHGIHILKYKVSFSITRIYTIYLVSLHIIKNHFEPLHTYALSKSLLRLLLLTNVDGFAKNEWQSIRNLNLLAN